MNNALQPNLQASADTLTVVKLIKNVQSGLVRIPSFQRGLRWETNDVIDLFDSVYRGYPIGTFLFSKSKADASKIKIGISEINAPATIGALWVVDGQQRITALTAVLTRPEPIPRTPDDPWVVYFDSSTQTFKAPIKDEDVPVSWVPVSALLDAAKLSEWVYNWGNSGDEKARARVFEAGARIRDYEIPIYIVESDDEHFLRDIFHRINNYGKSLKWAEIHDAIFGQKGEALTTLGDLAEELQSLGAGKLEEDQLLSCLIASKGLDVTRSFSEHYRRDENVLKNAVRNAYPAIRQVVEFLQNYAEIPHLRLLPRSTPLPVLTRFFTVYPKPKPRTLALLTRWTWRVLLGKANINERTLLRRAIASIKKDEEESVQSLLKFLSKQKLQSFELPSQFDARSASSRIVLVSLASLNPIDFYDGEKLNIGKLIENYDIDAFRRIIPTSGSLGRSPANRIFSIGTGSALREILERLPQLKYPEEVLESHAISHKAMDALNNKNYDEFLKERKHTLEKLVKDFGLRLAAWGQSDRPSIEYLVREEE